MKRFSMNWNLTYRCNLHCEHCYSRRHVAELKELNYEEAIKIVDFLKNSRVLFVNFGGGECALHPIILDIISYICSNTMITPSITTNSLLFSDSKVCQEFHKAGLRNVTVSIDGLRETHDFARHYPGLFLKAISTIKHLQENGFRVVVNTVVTRRNLAEIIQLLEYLVFDVGVKKIVLAEYKCGVSDSDLSLSPYEASNFFQDIKKWRKRNSCNVISVTDPLFGLSLSKEEEILFPGAKMRCDCGETNFSIMSNGDIVPCSFLPIPIGNALNHISLDEIMRNSKILEEIRNPPADPICGSCTKVDICKGGCKARAFNVSNKFDNGDPLCLIKLQSKWKQELLK